MELRAQIYELAVKGLCQRDIAAALCCKRQKVHYHIKKLEASGFLLCQNPNGNPKTYIQTTKPYGACQKNNGGGVDFYKKNPEIVRAHSLRFKCSILKLPEKIPHDKKWISNNTIFYNKKLTSDLGPISFTTILGKKNNKKILRLNLPERYLDYEQFKRFDKYLDRFVKLFYNEFQKTYNYKLDSDIQEYTEPHYAFSEQPEMLFLKDKFEIDLDSANIWTDRSKGFTEWETKKRELVKAKFELPERLLSLENKVDLLFNKFDKIGDQLFRLDKKIEIFSKKIDRVFPEDQPEPDDVIRSYV